MEHPCDTIGQPVNVGDYVMYFSGSRGLHSELRVVTELTENGGIRTRDPRDYRYSDSKGRVVSSSSIVKVPKKYGEIKCLIMGVPTYDEIMER